MSNFMIGHQEYNAFGSFLKTGNTIVLPIIEINAVMPKKVIHIKKTTTTKTTNN